MNGGKKGLGITDQFAMRQRVSLFHVQRGPVFKEHSPPCRERGGNLIAIGLGLGKGKRGLVPKSLNVQGGTGTQVSNPLGNLCRAPRLVRATKIHIPFLLRSQLRPTRRAVLRHNEGIFTAIAGSDYGGDDLGDNIPGFPQNDKVANQNAFTGNFTSVVQGCA